MFLKNTLLCSINVVVVMVSFTKGYAVETVTKLPEINGDKFNYFGFGSNMLTKRIRVQNPTANKIGVGILKDYRLDFSSYSNRWQGAPATIVPTENAFVYGTLWEIDLSNLPDIDNQEGVHEGLYYPMSVPIMMANNTLKMARVYLLVDQPKNAMNSIPKDELPMERRPSKSYLQCLVKGAIETGIVPWYVNWLKSIQHNGKIIEQLESDLDLQDVELYY